MEKSPRKNVVRGFSLVHDPSLAKYGVVLGGPPPSGSHYILEGEVGALAPGHRNVVRGFSLVHDPEGSHYKGGSLI